ncbi:hypothetical protein [Streptomyces sudanensis]|uniref:hypothetical protein n=1 Tax=Streptomyces sudanensis TaxID=436397 RepID=UPI0035585DE1
MSPYSVICIGVGPVDGSPPPERVAATQAPRTQNTARDRPVAQRFSATRRGARLIRLLAARRLAEWGHPPGTGAHDAVALVVAELAANAVLHGRVPGWEDGLGRVRDGPRAGADPV